MEQGQRLAEMRQKALAAATAWVDEHSKIETNSRGYPRDGWKEPTLSEKAEVTLRIAEWLLVPTTVAAGRAPVLVPPASTEDPRDRPPGY